jgi:hypothetical protein
VSYSIPALAKPILQSGELPIPEKVTEFFPATGVRKCAGGKTTSGTSIYLYQRIWLASSGIDAAG